MRDDEKLTRAWRLYEAGRQFNSSLTPDQYTMVKRNHEFYVGNQWPGDIFCSPAMDRLPHPVFNIIGRITDLFRASISAPGASVRVEPFADYDGSGQAPDQSPADFANSSLSYLLEKLNFDYMFRDAVEDGAETGDYCAHFWFDPDAQPYGGGLSIGARSMYKGEIRMEMVDGINVIFGNPHTADVESQPWILLVGRAPVMDLLREKDSRARRKKLLEAIESGEIRGDVETQDFIGNAASVDLTEHENEQALYILLYEKVETDEPATDEDGGILYEDVIDDEGFTVYEKDGKGNLREDAEGSYIPKRREIRRRKVSIHVTKATRTTVIYEDVDTGLSRYPIAWGNWKRQKNNFHGRALVTDLVPAQIIINQGYAMSTQYLRMTAFPKIIYNANLIPKWDFGIGRPIAVHGVQPGMTLPQVATSIPNPEMSNQMQANLDSIVSLTKECVGATDVQMGTANPDNTSALMVLQTNAEVPLENIRANLYRWTEGIATILLDMMGTYYGERPIIYERQFEEVIGGDTGMPRIDPMTGMLQTTMVTRKVIGTFNFSVFKNLAFDLRIDVGASSGYSEIAMVQTLDKLRADGTLDLLQYLDRIPDKLLPKKRQLEAEVRQRQASGQQANAGAGMAIPQPGSPMSGVFSQDGAAPAVSVDQIEGPLPGRIEQEFESLPNKAQYSAQRADVLRSANTM